MTAALTIMAMSLLVWVGAALVVSNVVVSCAAG